MKTQYTVKRSNIYRGGYKTKKFSNLDEAVAYARDARASGCVVVVRDAQGNEISF